MRTSSVQFHPPQIIKQNDKPMYAVIPYKEYQILIDMLDELRDLQDFDKAMTNPEELIPIEIVDKILAGEHPVRVWREYRGFTQQELANAAHISTPFLSQIEHGKRQASLIVMRALAQKLNIDIDELVP